MIISHQHKFIFIKTGKTAGTSIEVYLSKFCGPEDVVTPIIPPFPGHIPRNYRGLFNPIVDIGLNQGRGVRGTLSHFMKGERFWNHMSARVVRARITTEQWNSYFKFCVERNPWDKTLSHYYMEKSRGNCQSLDEYFKRRKFPVDFWRYTDSCGRIIVDCVIKYENLSEELSDVLTQMGIPFEGLAVHAKSQYRADRRPYWEALSPEQANTISRYFGKEIRTFGYKFENRKVVGRYDS